MKHFLFLMNLFTDKAKLWVNQWKQVEVIVSTRRQVTGHEGRDCSERKHAKTVIISRQWDCKYMQQKLDKTATD